MKVLGIDEAGRGPVIGPMIIAGVMIEEGREKMLGEVKDSKFLYHNNHFNGFMKFYKLNWLRIINKIVITDNINLLFGKTIIKKISITEKIMGVKIHEYEPFAIFIYFLTPIIFLKSFSIGPFLFGRFVRDIISSNTSGTIFTTINNNMTNAIKLPPFPIILCAV